MSQPKRRERAKQIHKYTDSLLEWWAKSSKEQREAGKKWYEEALDSCAEIAQRYNLPIERVVYAVAALSPLCEWSLNLKKADTLAEAVVKGEPLPLITTGRQQEAALQCLEGKLSALRGPKVRAFAHAIVGDEDACVIDKHMLSAMGWEKNHSPNEGVMYDDCAIALTVAAHCARAPTTHFQATVWLTAKNHKEEDNARTAAIQ